MPYMFGCGSGRLAKKEIERRAQIARKHNAQFIVTTGNMGNCVCGHGCSLDRCPVKNYWFTTQNLGEPFNRATAQAVVSEIAV